MKDLVERLRESPNCYRAILCDEAADLLERIYSQPVELPEQRGWQWLDTANFRKQLPDGAEPAAWNKLYTADQLTQEVQEATARALEAAAIRIEQQFEWKSSAKAAYEIRNLIGNVPLRGVK